MADFETTASELHRQMRAAYYSEIRQDMTALAAQIKAEKWDRDQLDEYLDEECSTESGARKVIITWQALVTVLASDAWLTLEEETGESVHSLTARHESLTDLISSYASAAYRADMLSELELAGIDPDTLGDDDSEDEEV